MLPSIWKYDYKWSGDSLFIHKFKLHVFTLLLFLFLNWKWTQIIILSQKHKIEAHDPYMYMYITWFCTHENKPSYSRLQGKWIWFEDWRHSQSTVRSACVGSWKYSTTAVAQQYTHGWVVHYTRYMYMYL